MKTSSKTSFSEFFYNGISRRKHYTNLRASDAFLWRSRFYIFFCKMRFEPPKQTRFFGKGWFPIGIRTYESYSQTWQQLFDSDIHAHLIKTVLSRNQQWQLAPGVCWVFKIKPGHPQDSDGSSFTHVSPYVTHCEAAVLLLNVWRKAVLSHAAVKQLPEPPGRLWGYPTTRVAQVNDPVLSSRWLFKGEKALAQSQNGVAHGRVV